MTVLKNKDMNNTRSLDKFSFGRIGGPSYTIELDNPFRENDPCRAHIYSMLQIEFARTAIEEIDKIPDQLIEDMYVFDPDKVPNQAFAALEYSGAWKRIKRKMQETHKHMINPENF
ncbi:hypothetical protein FH582_21790 (plasmid) [Leptospira interrogans]|uniref:hypothetical protein n=1 Tax=Leptospira interrogans TaxID=173 RepID=UPI001F0544B1|nr:hypothetical protein [Leptospira interrogans]UMQ56453.1 hypothetical protein FH582_21790 [Leptospira interrogans]